MKSKNDSLLDPKGNPKKKFAIKNLFPKEQIWGMLVISFLLLSGIAIKYILGRALLEEPLSLPLEESLLEGNGDGTLYSYRGNDNSPIQGNQVEKVQAGEDIQTMTISIKGGVETPGEYLLEAGATLADLLAIATLKQNVRPDCNVICQDMLLRDGQHIYIPEYLCKVHP